jgi:hypothetical protein
MLGFVIDNIFFLFGGLVFQLWSAMFLRAFEADFFHGLLKSIDRNYRKLDQTNSDVLSLNNSRFDDIYMASIRMSVKLRLLLILKILFLTLAFTSISTMVEDKNKTL